MNVIANILALLVVLCILVILHEAGHFVTARAFGIRPYIFSFGIGWRLVGLQKRGGRWRVSFGASEPPTPEEDAGTDYRISLIPFGGYVMLQGESLSEGVSGDAREFRTRPRWQQLIVYVAGVALNILLAFCLVTALTWNRGVVFDDPKDPPIIQAVVAGSAAEKAGLRSGDKLVEIEGRDARDMIVRIEEILYAPGKTKTLTIERGGKREHIAVPIGMMPKSHLGDPGFEIQGSPVIQSVNPNGPAGRAGMQPGDTVVRVEDHEGPSTQDVMALIHSKQAGPVHLELRRAGARIVLDVTPERSTGKPMIGVLFANGPVRKVGLAGAAAESARYCAENVVVLYISLKKLVLLKISPRVLSGPIELAQFAGSSWRAGSEAYIGLLAFVSLQLGIINLLPIPGLDGGQMLILLVEGAIRRSLPDGVKQWVVTSGFALLLLIFGIVIWFDIQKLIS